MGMDVFGCNPKNEVGRHFRATVWEWEPIHELIGTLCRDLLGDELLNAIGWNEGQGPTDDGTCSVMAERFSEWLKTNEGEYVSLCPKLAIGEFARLITGCATGDAIQSPYRVSRETLDEWISFLRSCGGFEVF